MVFLFLIYNKNANNIVIHLPYSSQEGRSIYRGLCSHCHGISKEGSMGPSLLKINEKPKFDFLINSGLYLINPDIIDLIPKNKFYDLTTLINSWSQIKENAINSEGCPLVFSAPPTGITIKNLLLSS